MTVRDSMLGGGLQMGRKTTEQPEIKYLYSVSLRTFSEWAERRDGNSGKGGGRRELDKHKKLGTTPRVPFITAVKNILMLV